MRWYRTLCAAQRTRKSSLRVDSSPTRSVKCTVVRITAGVRAERSDELGGEAIPVGVEVVSRRVEEREAGAVGWLLGALEHGGVQGAPEHVGSEVVALDVADDRGRLDRVEEALQDRVDALLRQAASGVDASGLAARARSKRCVRSASSSCSARASASRTVSETPVELSRVRGARSSRCSHRRARRPPRGAVPDTRRPCRRAAARPARA